MNLTRRRASQAFFITLGICLICLAVALNVTWVMHNGRRLAIDVVGVLLFAIREIRRNERQDSFLNAVTHELKTPVASIRLYLDTLERRQVDEEQRRAFYRIMRADTDRLLGTVNQVLKAGELGGRARSGDRTRLELQPLLAECIASTLDRHHLEKDAIVQAKTPGDVRLFVLGYVEDLRTAILNLLDNAVKYSPQGVHIRCRLSIEHYTFAVLAITDTGLRLPATELKRIFRRFYRADASDRAKIKGTGLGLFLVHTIARQHGGSIRALSAGPGEGVTMLLKLPLALS